MITRDPLLVQDTKLVSRPIRPARISSAPDWLIEPANTAAPAAFSISSDSPVIRDWSTKE